MSEPVPPSALDWNNLFSLTVYVAIVALAIVMGTMIYFTIRYRERNRQARFIPETGLSKSRARDAIVFASISIIILLSLTVVSFRLTPNARFPPASPSLTINVTAFQWAFDFTYPNGVYMVDTVTVPANSTIVFNVTSIDVMHNFYLVEYRVSIDAIPGKSNIIWIDTPPLDGNSQLNYTIRCKELCGPGHADMLASLKVIDPAVFSLWLNNQTTKGKTATNSSMNMGG